MITILILELAVILLPVCLLKCIHSYKIRKKDSRWMVMHAYHFYKKGQIIHRFTASYKVIKIIDEMHIRVRYIG